MVKITETIINVGVNDNKIDLFEGQYVVKNGMCYNSYVILDDDIAVVDSVDINFKDEWLNNIKETLNGKKPKYLIIQHMEPDHSANVAEFLKVYPETILVGNVKTFRFLEQFFRKVTFQNKLIVNNNDSLDLGKHKLTFVFAPMVHWPEVMMTYDATDKVLFSADAFGKFGNRDVKEDWLDEARRYYIGIVGKYGNEVMKVLNLASALDIEKICSLHGPLLDNNLNYYIGKYKTWASYEVEKDGVLILYASIYGNTKNAAEVLKNELLALKVKEVKVFDVSRCDMSNIVAEAFAFGRIIFMSPTYNMCLFPSMDQLLHKLQERNFKNKTIGFVENGTWAPIAAKVMKEKLSTCKDLKIIEPSVKIMSTMSDENILQLKELAKNIIAE